MRYQLGDLNSRMETLEEMSNHVEDHFLDIGNFGGYAPEKIFDLVKNMPYFPDPDFYEIVSRPSYLLDPEIFPGIDCKKKAILIGAWAKLHGYPYRFMTGSEMEDTEPHHVFPIVKLPEIGWIAMDATMPENEMGQITAPYNGEIY